MGGDTLASGAMRATFGPAKVTEEKWADIFDDYDPAQYLKKVEVQQAEAKKRREERAKVEQEESERLEKERNERRKNKPNLEF